MLGADSGFMVSMDGESDTATPYGADRERIGDVRDGVTIDQQQISAGSRDDTASVGESETACGSGSSSSKRLDGCQSSCDEQLQFVMHAGAVGEATEVGYGADTSVPVRMSTPALCRAATVARTSSKLPCGKVLKQLRNVLSQAWLSLELTRSSAARSVAG